MNPDDGTLRSRSGLFIVSGKRWPADAGVDRMGKKSRVFGLGPEKMARLMNIAAGTEKVGWHVTADEEKSELLRDRLAEALPPDSSITGMLPVIPDSLGRTLGLAGGKAIEDILSNPQSDTAVVIRIKDYHNLLSERAGTIPERDTAIAIYYAAIASALVFHDRKVTRFSYDRLERSFSSLIKKVWMSPELIALFEKALNVCRNPSAIRELAGRSLRDISEDTTI